MKLLATDYDGTFKTSPNNFFLNIEAVNRFMKNGNKFAIVTGRDYCSIKNELDYFGVKYDYLSCNNGLIIFDKNDRIVFSSILDDEKLLLIRKYAVNDLNLKSIDFYNLYSHTYVLKNILEVCVKFNDLNALKKYKSFIENNLKDINCYIESNIGFIGNNITKADAVSNISEIENINCSDIYTTGDNQNDLCMLEKFNGYKVSSSTLPNIVTEIEQVHTLIKQING